MTNTVFSIEEMENMFEIGRLVQNLIEHEEIEVEDSKNAFWFAMKLSAEFEKEYPDTEDYYYDLEEFVMDKLIKEFDDIKFEKTVTRNGEILVKSGEKVLLKKKKAG
mgnify:CR=1 FL=1